MTRIILYALGLYTFVFCAGYIINSHGQETGQRSCSEYLRICETSCTLRGELYWFGCQGPGFQPDRDRYRCICADEALRVNRSSEFAQNEKKHPAQEADK